MVGAVVNRELGDWAEFGGGFVTGLTSTTAAGMEFEWGCVSRIVGLVEYGYLIYLKVRMYIDLENIDSMVQGGLYGVLAVERILKFDCSSDADLKGESIPVMLA